MKKSILALALMGASLVVVAGEQSKNEFRFSDDQFKRMRKAERIELAKAFSRDCKDYSSPMTFEFAMNVEQLVFVSYVYKQGSKVFDDKSYDVYFCFAPDSVKQGKGLTWQLDSAACVVLVKKGTLQANRFSRFLKSIGIDGVARCYLTLAKRSLIEGLFTQAFFGSSKKGEKYFCMLREFMPCDEYKKRCDAVKSVGAKDTKSVKKNEPFIMPSISNSVSIAMFKADVAAKPVRYLAKAALDDYYNFEFLDSKQTHWSVKFDCKDIYGNTDFIHGYVQKKCALGEKVVSMFKDGKEHIVEVVLSHTSKNENAASCDILLLKERPATDWKED